MIQSLQEVISIPILSHVEWTEHDRTQLQWKVLGAVTSYAADGQRPQAESATALFSTFEADPKAPVDHVPMATDHDGLCVFGMMTFVNTFPEL